MNTLLDTIPAGNSPDAATYPHGSGICYKPPVRPLPPGCYVCRAGWGPCACGAKIGTIGYRTVSQGPVVCETCAGLKGKKR